MDSYKTEILKQFSQKELVSSGVRYAPPTAGGIILIVCPADVAHLQK